MVRVFLVRHAESVENLKFEDYFRKNQQHIQNAKDGNEDQNEISPWVGIIQQIAEILPHHGDCELTDLGYAQAEAFGIYWSKILQHKAKNGKLHVYVSPQHRTLLTVRPFMRELNYTYNIDIDCTVIHDLHEHTPPKAKVDMIREQNDTDLMQLRKEGRFPEMNLLRKRKWRNKFTPAGLTGQEMLTLASVGSPQGNNSRQWLNITDASIPLHSRWYVKGQESDEYAEERANNIGNFLREKQKLLSNDDVIVCVSHGAIMGRIIRNLMNLAPQKSKFSFEGSHNTCVTVLTLPSPTPIYEKWRTFKPTPLQCILEIQNNTIHLGSYALNDWTYRRGIVPFDEERWELGRKIIIEKYFNHRQHHEVNKISNRSKL
eukprot:g1395.t1